MEYCSCGKQAVVRTSWTPRNPDCRFYGCPEKGSFCPFIGWYDPSMYRRSTEIILGLLRSKNEAEAKGRKMKNYLIMSRVGFVLVLIAMKMD
ncbi:hypothetical protein QVD17_09022 [Tagetes erecta]|uniref:Zinc finger GRF-type domain-containing protein n=1 Tax=Tagetes erecta TaxID=13708 RepID=A0AAD8L6I0_TARER|nr:hypothetical protein QVD17_09022 [Tagetes erecta]